MSRARADLAGHRRDMHLAFLARAAARRRDLQATAPTAAGRAAAGRAADHEADRDPAGASRRSARRSCSHRRRREQARAGRGAGPGALVSSGRRDGRRDERPSAPRAFVWMSRLPSTRMFSLSATKVTPALARASRMVTIPRQPVALAMLEVDGARAGGWFGVGLWRLGRGLRRSGGGRTWGLCPRVRSAVVPSSAGGAGPVLPCRLVRATSTPPRRLSASGARRLRGGRPRPRRRHEEGASSGTTGTARKPPADHPPHRRPGLRDVRKVSPHRHGVSGEAIRPPPGFQRYCATAPRSAVAPDE